MGLVFIILRVALRKGQQMHLGTANAPRDSKCTLGEGGCLLSTKAGKKWLQECEAACFLIFIHSETTAYGLVLPMFMFRMGLPTWVNSIS